MPQRCYICEGELVPVPRDHKGQLQDNHATRDHIPPAAIFCDPKPSNLITVACCNKHNGKHSGMDERLRMLLSLELGRNEGGKQVLLQKVFGSTFKKIRQRKFVTQIATTMRVETVMTTVGPKSVAVFTVDGKEILDCMANIVRGLLRYFYPSFNYHGHDFMALDIHSATLEKGNREAQLRLIKELATKTKRDSRGNKNEFQFWHQVDEQHQQGAWLLVFYEAVAFIVSHSQIPFDKRFATTGI
jgi:hypothetical protein